MSKFKMGDKVRVKEDLVAGNYYNDVCFSDSMDEYRGEITTISFIDSQGDYNLQGCGIWFFSDNMLEPARLTIKDLAAIMTRSEFEEMLKKTNYGWGKCDYSCPNDIGIEIRECIGNDSCRECWLKAIENVTFKNEIDVREPTTKTEVEYDEKLKCYFISDGKRTLCFKDFGMSSTHPNDQYDEEMGKALAYKRFMGGCC